MDYIKQSLKKIFVSVLVYSFVSGLCNLILTGLKMELVNLDVRGFWGYEYPSMPFHPENYTYIDELIKIINTLLNFALIIGFRRFCIKKLNEEPCNTKEAFLFEKPKCFFCALFCEYVPSLVISHIELISTFIESTTISDIFYNPSVLMMTIGVINLAFSIGFAVLGVYLWLTPYIYLANNTKSIRYAFSNSFSIAPKYFWKIFGLILCVSILREFVGSISANILIVYVFLSISIFLETSVSMILGYTILKKENMIEDVPQITIQ